MNVKNAQMYAGLFNINLKEDQSMDTEDKQGISLRPDPDTVTPSFIPPIPTPVPIPMPSFGDNAEPSAIPDPETKEDSLPLE